jgi:hypothetical protein
MVDYHTRENISHDLSVISIISTNFPKFKSKLKKIHKISKFSKIFNMITFSVLQLALQYMMNSSPPCVLLNFGALDAFASHT